MSFFKADRRNRLSLREIFRGLRRAILEGGGGGAGAVDHHRRAGDADSEVHRLGSQASGQLRPGPTRTLCEAGQRQEYI